MADYSINVKAKLNVEEFKNDVNSALKSKPVEVNITPHIIFDANDTTTAQLKKEIDKYFERERTPLRFALYKDSFDKDVSEINKDIQKAQIDSINVKTILDSDTYKDFTEKIEEIKSTIKDLNKSISISIGFDEKDIESLSSKINALVKLYQTFNENGIDIGLGFNEEDISKLNQNIERLRDLYQTLDEKPVNIGIKFNEDEIEALGKQVENYFKDNPVKLALSEDTNVINLKALTEAWQEYSKTAQTLNADVLQNQKDSIKLQAYALQEQYKANQLTVEEYYQKLKQLRDDDSNNAILLAKGSSATRIEIEKQLTQAKIALENEKIKKAEEAAQAEIALENEKAEKVKEARQSITDSLTSQTQKALNDFTEKANALISNTESIRESSEEYKNLIAVVDEYVQSLENVRANYKNGLIDGEEFRKQITEAFVDGVNIENLPEEMKEKIGGFFSETLNKLAEDFKNSFNTSRDVVSEFYNTLSEGQTFFDQFDNEFKEFGKVTLNDFYDKISVFKNFAEEIGFEKLSQNIQNITKDVEDFVKNKDAEQSLEFYKTQFNELHERLLKVEEGFKNYNKELSDSSITEEEAHKRLTGLINEIEEISLVYDELKKAINFEEITDNLDNFQSDSINTFTELGQEIRQMSELAEEGIFPVDALGNKTYRIKQLIQELQEYTVQALNEENKARQVSYEQDVINRRESLDKTLQESIQKEEEASEKTKAALRGETETHKRSLDERANNLQEFANYIKEKNQEFKNDIDSVSQKEKEVTELYKQKKEQIEKINQAEKEYKNTVNTLTELYKTRTYTFEEYKKSILEVMQKASEEGLVSPELLQKTSLLVDEFYKKIQDQREKANKKAEQERQKEEQRVVKWAENLTKKNIAEKEKEAKEIEEANQKAIKKELENTQDLYNKKLISAEEYVSRMKTILPNAFNTGVDGAQKFQNSVDKVEKELQEAKDKTDSFSNSLKSFGTSSNNLFNSLMRYFGVTQIFSAVQNSFSKMVTEVRNLDAELTEFKKVSDLTEEGLNKFIDDSYTLGESVAKTGTEVVTATTLFKKMGHTVDESMQLAKNALMWTNVADGMVSVEESANMLISTMKAYGLQAEDTTHIIDALNEVSNNYSTSSSALSNNLSTVAATLASSGVSLEQTIGLMTAGIEIMPDKASKVANGLKTISQRIRQVDGATSDKLDEFLGSKGMSRYDKVTGQLKSTYDILKEISDLWPKLTINERQYFGEVMAGKNQITVLNSLMMNFKTAIDATNTALDSENSAFKENQRVMDSIQGHINAFKSAFSELSKDVISSDAIKTVVDFGTKIIEWLDDIVKNHGPALIKTIASIGTALASLKVAQFAKNIPNLITSLSKVDPILAAITVGVGAVTFVISEFVQEAEKASKQAEELKEISKSFLQEGQEESEKTQQSLKDTIAEYEKLKETLSSTTDIDAKDKIYVQLSEIEKQLKNQGINVNLINGSYEEQIALLKQAYIEEKKITLEQKKRAREKEQIEFNPVETVASQKFDSDYTLGGDGLFGNAFKSDEQKIEEATENINKIVISGINKTKETLANGQKAIADIQGRTLEEVLNDASLTEEQKIKILEDAIIKYDSMAETAGLSAKRATELMIKGLQSGDTTLENTSAVAQEKFEKQEEVFHNWAGILALIVKSMEENKDKSAEIIAEEKELMKAELDAMNVDLNKFSSESLQGLIQAINDVDTGKLDISNLPPQYQQFSQIISDTESRTTFLSLAVEALQIAFAKEAEGMDNASDSADNLNGTEEKLKTTLSGAIAILDEYASKAEILAQAQEDVSNTGQITAESLKKIADAGLMAYLTFDEETKSLGVNIEAFEKDNAALEANAIASYVAGQEAKLLEELKGIVAGSMNTSAEATNNDSGALQNLSVAAEEATAENWQLALSAYAASEGIDTTGEKAAEVKAKIDEYSVSIRDGVAAIHSYFGSVSSYSLGTVRGASHSGGSSSSSSAAEREAQQAQRDAERAQREAEQAARQAQQDWKEAFKIEYNKLKTYLDSELITYEQYYQALEELNQHFFAGRTEFEEEYWKYQDEIVKGRKKYLEDELKDYFQKGEKILKHQLNVEYITEEEYYDALTLLYESYYTDKEKYEEEYWKLEEEIYKLRKKQIKELEDELKDLYKEIEDLHKEYVKSLEDDLDEVETTISFAIDVIDEEIQKLKDEKTAIDEANDAREESIKLQELEDALERARNKKVRVYKKGEGFVYEQDTTAISQAQTALDKYKQEAQHKKRLSNIDEEIKKLEEYKKEWQNISANYKKAQDEMTAKAILGENAREEVLRREHNAVTKVGNRYIAVKNAIVKANEATIDNLEAYIGDATQAGTFSYEIERIKNKIDEIQSKTVTLQVNTSQASTSVSNIIVAIDALKNKLESQYSTQNLNVWLASYKSMIDEAYHYDPTGGYSGGSSSGGDYSGGSGSSGSGSSSGGNNQSGSGSSNGIQIGSKVKFSSNSSIVPGTTSTVEDAWWYNGGDYSLDVIDIKPDGTLRIGKNGTIWYDVSPDSLIAVNDSSSSNNGTSNTPETPSYNPGDTLWEDGVYKYADQDGNLMPMSVIQQDGQRYYYNPITGETTPIDSGSSSDSGNYTGGGNSDDGIYQYDPIDWQGQGYQDIGEYYADYRQQMEDYYHNLYGYHASGTIGTTTKKFVINENGIEAMVTPDGTVISAPSTGYGVIKNEYTERLTDFAADPLGFLGRMFTGYSGTYQHNNNAKNEVININGSLTLPNVTDGQSFVDSIRNVALQYTTRRR